MYDIIELNNKLVSDLRDIAIKLNIPRADKLKKQDLIYQILDFQALNPEGVAALKQSEKDKLSAASEVSNLEITDQPLEDMLEDIKYDKRNPDSIRTSRDLVPWRMN